MIEVVIAARHGYFLKGAPSFVDGPLTQEGIVQSEELGQSIKLFLEGKPAVVFTSPLQRAKETALIIAGVLEVGGMIFPGFEDDRFESGASQFQRMYDNANDEAALIAVGHFIAPSGIINSARIHYGFSDGYPSRQIQNGTALALTVQTGKVTSLP